MAVTFKIRSAVLLGALVLASTTGTSFAGTPVINKTALAGQTIDIVNIGSANPDCSAAPPATIRIVQAPAYGKAEVVESDMYPSYPVTNPRYQCNKTKVPSTAVRYTAPAGFTGTDLMSLEVFTVSGGDSNEVKVLITVK